MWIKTICREDEFGIDGLSIDETTMKTLWMRIPESDESECRVFYSAVTVILK
eukprot:01683.XXX_3794_3549_1 [CDS] Oithona nana genome sequencing.